MAGRGGGGGEEDENKNEYEKHDVEFGKQEN